MNRQSTEGFYGTENALYGTITMDTCHHKFALIRNVNHQECTKCKLWTLADNDMSMLAHASLITNVPLKWGLLMWAVLITGEVMQCRGREYVRNTFIFLLILL